mmetsp:Transcript_27993/g.68450  ORF Transcript_27993/g.68450 Transcript_27993/m.68450 type:complete len:923 (-) Transcript_27993:481-3249(-)
MPLLEGGILEVSAGGDEILPHSGHLAQLGRDGVLGELPLSPRCRLEPLLHLRLPILDWHLHHKNILPAFGDRGHVPPCLPHASLEVDVANDLIEEGVPLDLLPKHLLEALVLLGLGVEVNPLLLQLLRHAHDTVQELVVLQQGRVLGRRLERLDLVVEGLDVLLQAGAPLAHVLVLGAVEQLQDVLHLRVLGHQHLIGRAVDGRDLDRVVVHERVVLLELLKVCLHALLVLVELGDEAEEGDKLLHGLGLLVQPVVGRVDLVEDALLLLRRELRQQLLKLLQARCWGGRYDLLEPLCVHADDPNVLRVRKDPDLLALGAVRGELVLEVVERHVTSLGARAELLGVELLVVRHHVPELLKGLEILPALDKRLLHGVLEAGDEVLVLVVVCDNVCDRASLRRLRLRVVQLGELLQLLVAEKADVARDGVDEPPHDALELRLEVVCGGDEAQVPLCEHNLGEEDGIADGLALRLCLLLGLPLCFRLLDPRGVHLEVPQQLRHALDNHRVQGVEYHVVAEAQEVVEPPLHHTLRRHDRVPEVLSAWALLVAPPRVRRLGVGGVGAEETLLERLEGGDASDAGTVNGACPERVQLVEHRPPLHLLVVEELLQRAQLPLLERVEARLAHVHAHAPDLQEGLLERGVHPKEVLLQELCALAHLAVPDRVAPDLVRLPHAVLLEHGDLDDCVEQIVLPLPLLEVGKLRLAVHEKGDAKRRQRVEVALVDLRVGDDLEVVRVEGRDVVDAVRPQVHKLCRVWVLPQPLQRFQRVPRVAQRRQHARLHGHLLRLVLDVGVLRDQVHLALSPTHGVVCACPRCRWAHGLRGPQVLIRPVGGRRLGGRRDPQPLGQQQLLALPQPRLRVGLGLIIAPVCNQRRSWCISVRCPPLQAGIAGAALPQCHALTGDVGREGTALRRLVATLARGEKEA